MRAPEPEPSIDRFAQIRADMESGVPRDVALANAGLTPDAWIAVQRGWLERMGADLERGRFELTARYTQAFLERQRERMASAQSRAERSSVESSALLAAPHAPLEALAPGETPAKPTFLRKDETPPARPPSAPPSPGAASHAPLGATAWFDASVMQAALPFMKQTAGSASPPAAAQAPVPRPEPPVVPKGKPALGATSFALELPKLPALPFKGDRTPPAPPAPAHPPPSPPAAAPQPTATDPVPTRPANPRGTNPPVAPKSGLAVGATMFALDVSNLPVLPFQGDRAPPAPPAAAPPPSPAPHVAAPQVTMGETPKPPLKAESQAAASGRLELTLEQYASLCVEMGLDPQHPTEVAHRYGLTVERARELDAHWKARIATYPGVRTSFDAAYQKYRAWRMANLKAPDR